MRARFSGPVKKRNIKLEYSRLGVTFFPGGFLSNLIGTILVFLIMIL